MAEKHDFLDDLIDIQSDWQALSNPLDALMGSLGGNDAAVPSSDNGDARHVCPSDSQYSQRCSQWRVDVLSR